MENKLIDINYHFHFSKNDKIDFIIIIDPETMLMTPAKLNDGFAWTKLEFKRCPCCQLNRDEHPYCPVAVNIADLVMAFKNKISYEKCIVRCKTPERIYLKKTSLMEGLSSIIGLIMATSACPHMAMFRPMARFHLPFSTVEETSVRSISMYLLQQYFIYEDNGIPDFDLKKLHVHYETVKAVNVGLLERIKGLHNNDADKNAIVMFHTISEMLSAEMKSNLNSIKRLFKASYLEI